ncbi:MAG: uracil-DNA glycosylase [Desulfuromonadales bacterium]|nr:uracil-DNA glycosylase [Desulfuromonadales bacterium]
MIQQEQTTVIPNPDPAILRASLNAYLEELRDSGLDGFPCDVSQDSSQPPTRAATCGDIQLHQGVTKPSADSADHHETLENIRRNLGDCQRCKLGRTRKNLVFGVGNPNARLVFVGEGPGADEDEKGEPFVGDAGRMLNRIITAMGITREEVYICNVVKCRPPGNRNPEADEIESCSPFLMRQLKSIKPEVIVALGKFAAQTLLETREPISKLRGRFRNFHGIPLMPTYHPSYLLRSGGNSDSFWDVWEDMTQVLQLLKLPVPDKSRKK